MIVERPRRWRKRLIRIIAAVVAIPVLVVGGYVAYVFMSYHRLPDSAEQHSQNVNAVAALDTDYTVVTWNVGFGAYCRDFSFFMDGGTEGRAYSEAQVLDDIGHMAEVLAGEGADHILLQEVDVDATRSWHVDETEFFRDAFPEYQSYFAQNYDSPYLLVPPSQPHGAARSGLLTLSSRDIFRGERYSLPVETGWRKILDLDRCYSLCRVPTADGHYLCLYNVHMSAYTADGSIATEQLKLLAESMRREYAEGNYCVAGGDFNKDLIGDAAAVFGVSGEGFSWARPVEPGILVDGVSLVPMLDDAAPVPSCRNCDTGYIPGQTFVLIADGFVVSDNVTAVESHVIDDDFTASDHNPVKLTFRLNSGGN